jgi:hypothetical protein
MSHCSDVRKNIPSGKIYHPDARPIIISLRLPFSVTLSAPVIIFLSPPRETVNCYPVPQILPSSFSLSRSVPNLFAIRPRVFQRRLLRAILHARSILYHPSFTFHTQQLAGGYPRARPCSTPPPRPPCTASLEPSFLNLSILLFKCPFFSYRCNTDTDGEI